MEYRSAMPSSTSARPADFLWGFNRSLGTDKLLLGEQGYQRHTMNIHRVLHGKRALHAGDFERWLMFFKGAVDDNFQGPFAERAKRVATSIAGNMESSLPSVKAGCHEADQKL